MTEQCPDRGLGDVENTAIRTRLKKSKRQLRQELTSKIKPDPDFNKKLLDKISSLPESLRKKEVIFYLGIVDLGLDMPDGYGPASIKYIEEELELKKGLEEILGQDAKR